MKYLLLFISLGYMGVLTGQNELRPLFDKSLMDIQPIENPGFQFEPIPYYIDKTKLKTDFDFIEQYIRQGMRVTDFRKIPINANTLSRQIFTVKDKSGNRYMIINRMPGFPFNKIESPNKGYGTSVSFDFNKVIYYAFHPGAKAQKKRTLLKRTQINCHVYQNE